jgi:hypothetical protein
MYLNAALLAVLWVSTFGLQMPAHRALAEGYDERLVSRLVAGNWIRTAAWTARAVLLVALLAVGASRLSEDTSAGAPTRVAEPVIVGAEFR